MPNDSTATRTRSERLMSLQFPKTGTHVGPPLHADIPDVCFCAGVGLSGCAPREVTAWELECSFYDGRRFGVLTCTSV